MLRVHVFSREEEKKATTERICGKGRFLKPVFIV